MIVFLVNIAGFLVTIKILSDWISASYGEGVEPRLRAFFEIWQSALENPSPNTILEVPFSALALTYDRVFGPKAFSWQSFRKTCVFGSLFMGASLGFTGLLYGKPFAMNLLPWQSFSASLQYLKIFSTNLAMRHLAGDPYYMVQNSSDLAKLNGTPYAVLFTIYFLVVLIILSAALVSLSISVSRLFLRQMVASHTLFGIFVLFISNTALLIFIGATASLLFFVLLNVWTWPFVPLLFAITKISLIKGVGVASTASLCSLFFSGPWLKVVVVVSLFPSILVAILSGFGIIGSALRKGINPLASFLIRLSLRSPKGIISFWNATLSVLALICTCLAYFWGLLAHFNLKLGSPTFFGVDFVIFSIFIFFSALFFSWINAIYYQRHFDTTFGFLDVLVLFVGAVCIIAFGYYIEAILDCIFPIIFPPQSGLSDNISLPAVCSLIPGSIIGYIYVVSRLAKKRWLHLALYVFIVLLFSDLRIAVCGACAYRDTVISIVCDMLGAPFAAIILVQFHSFLFLKGRSCPKSKHGNE